MANKKKQEVKIEDPKSWELSIGLYPGIVFGLRTYNYDDSTLHVLYIPFVDVALEIYK
jgi:hypothetical protein